MRLPVPVAAAFLLVSTAAHLPAAHAQLTPGTYNGPISQFGAEVSMHYAAWDADKNRELSQGELDAACADTKITGPEAAALAAIKRASRAKTAALVLPISLEKLWEIASVPVPSPAAPSTATAPPNLNKFFGEANAKIGKTRRSLFSSDGPPRLDAVRQGKLGDCFCLAPLGAMLARDPQEVVTRFHADPKDPEKYEVTIGTHVIPVFLPTDAEIALSATARNNGVWVNLYEKAVGICRNEAKPVEKRTASPYDDVTRGGSAGTMLSLLTGHKIERFSCAWAKKADVPQTERDEKLKTLRTELTTTQKANLLMTCGTNKTTTPGMTPNHAYAILGYDEKTDALKLWNPHGDNFTPKGEPGKTHGYARKNGVFSIPIGDFVDIVAGAAFERNEPVPAEKVADLKKSNPSSVAVRPEQLPVVRPLLEQITGFPAGPSALTQARFPEAREANEAGLVAQARLRGFEAIPIVRLEKGKSRFEPGERVFFWVGGRSLNHGSIPKTLWNTTRLHITEPNGTRRTEPCAWPIDGWIDRGWEGGAGLWRTDPKPGVYQVAFEFAGLRTEPVKITVGIPYK